MGTYPEGAHLVSGARTLGFRCGPSRRTRHSTRVAAIHLQRTSGGSRLRSYGGSEEGHARNPRPTNGTAATISWSSPSMPDYVYFQDPFISPHGQGFCAEISSSKSIGTRSWAAPPWPNRQKLNHLAIFVKGHHARYSFSQRRSRSSRSSRATRLGKRDPVSVSQRHSLPVRFPRRTAAGTCSATASFGPTHSCCCVRNSERPHIRDVRGGRLEDLDEIGCRQRLDHAALRRGRLPRRTSNLRARAETAGKGNSCHR